MTDGPLDAKRPDFLIAMYNQLMNDINRHIVVIWQSVSVLFAAFAGLSLVQSNTVSLDVVASLIVVVCIWVVAHTVDGGYWYNRNLVIIANIERQFLKSTDLRDIHYYFGAHRQTGRMITHLRIQRNLAAGVGLVILLVHFGTAVWPFWQRSMTPGLAAVLPYAIAVVGIISYKYMEDDAARRYDEFIRNSPGIAVDTAGVQYGGPGHPILQGEATNAGGGD